MMSLPNLLTVFRLLAAPAVAIVFVVLPRGIADGAALILFIAASVTDWLDGYLARGWNQVSKLGTMLDPIADKAMVVIALAVLVHVSSLGSAILFPAAIILFREVFVSGLREYLGDVAGTLRVTRLAKWKTAVQMTAIAVLIGQGWFEHLLGTSLYGMDPETHAAIIAGDLPDTLGLWWKDAGYGLSTWLGLGLVWLAAVLTAITGLDYFRKARPHLED
ncbi:MAG: CDP-diacylglycerol--glycerol-3-phosphate 3-phosphatidyltransferase [Paracoccaceae bacterium]